MATVIHRSVQEGNSVDFLNDTGAQINAGTLIVRGRLSGITKRDVPDGKIGTIHTAKSPVFETFKQTGGGVVFDAGDLVEQDPGNGNVV